MSNIVAKIWTNGEFTCGITPTRPASPMGLSDASNSVKVKPEHRNNARGRQNTFTSQAKRIVRNACGLLCDRRFTSFLTLTLPPLCREEVDTVSQQADTLIDRFNRWLRRRLVSAGLPAEIITVREFQKRGALHWHLAFQGCHVVGNWAVSKDDIKTQWSVCLTNMLKRHVDCHAATRIERVRKDVGRYLSKYMSKTAANCDRGGDPSEGNSETLIPAGRAWNISNSLRRRIKIDRSERLGLAIWVHRDSLDFQWIFPIVWEGKLVGLVGQFKCKGDKVRDYIDSVVCCV